MRSVVEKAREYGMWGSLTKLRNRILAPFSISTYRNPEGDADGGFGGSDFARIYQNKTTGAPAYKYHHYFDIYERHLGHLRGKPLKFLEIGVYHGGSLELWRSYFGDRAVIYGIDIDPACAAFDGAAGKVRIGSQADPAFLKAVVEEMGGVDVVVDDGSHDSLHVRRSFEALFPLLSEGGVYLVEDMACSYWPVSSGGYRWPWSFINVSKRLIDDMNHWFHDKGERFAATKGCLKGMHFYPSVIVFDKGMVERPVASRRPAGAGPAPVAA